MSISYSTVLAVRHEAVIGAIEQTEDIVCTKMNVRGTEKPSCSTICSQSMCPERRESWENPLMWYIKYAIIPLNNY